MGLRQNADLRGDLLKKRGVDTPMLTLYVFLFEIDVTKYKLNKLSCV